MRLVLRVPSAPNSITQDPQGGSIYETAILLVENNDNNATVYAALLEHFGLRVLCSRNGLEGVRMADEAGSDGFLGKPCAVRQLLAEIERFLGPIPVAA